MVNTLKENKVRIVLIDSTMFNSRNFNLRRESFRLFNNLNKHFKNNNINVFTSKITYLKSKKNDYQNFSSLIKTLKKDRNFKMVDNGYSCETSEYKAALSQVRKRSPSLFITNNQYILDHIRKLNDNVNKYTHKIYVITSFLGRPLLLPDYRLNKDYVPVKVKGTKYKRLIEESGKVIIDNKEVKLLEKINSGGEGEIYRVAGYPNMVAKIYFEEKITTFRINKIKLMVKNPFYLETVAWPKKLVYNLKRQIIGYLMSEVSGDDLSLLFKPPVYVKHKFPKMRRQDIVNICILILETINTLHNSGIVMVDLNPRNILITHDARVYFVDVDSYQVENYQSGVMTEKYRAPELQNNSSHHFISYENERFTVALLIFEILMMGRTPYAKKNKDSLSNNMHDGDFPYYLDNKKTLLRAPGGVYPIIWSHFPYRTKKMFINIFDKNGKNYNINKRLTPYEMKEVLISYKYALYKGFLQKDNKDANKLFPRK